MWWFALAHAGDFAVVGGNAARPGDWPDAAAVYIDEKFGCSGTLIAPDLVLTAGHCEHGITSVIVGTNDHTSGGEELGVEWAVSHPDLWTTYDAALVRLDAPATVAPRVLAQDCIVDNWVLDGADVAIVGFGARDENGVEWGTTLYDARTTIQDDDCDDTSRGCNAEVAPGGELIAGGNGVDSCSGDSGGPLYLLTDVGDFLVGITSRGAMPADSPCGDGGIYVRADALVDWIEETTGEPLTRPDCEGMNRRPRPLADDIVGVVLVGGSTTVVVNDPDEGDTHVLRVAREPEHGTVSIGDDGRVAYVPTGFFVGSDSFAISVTDDGDPRLSGQVDIGVTIVEAPGETERRACGCGSTALSSSWLLLLLAACAMRSRDPEDESGAETLLAEDLWTADAPVGASVTVTDLIVTSPRTLGLPAFFVQGASGAGLLVRLDGTLADWPPAIGSRVSLTGIVSTEHDAPVLLLASAQDGTVHAANADANEGSDNPLVTPFDPDVPPWTLVGLDGVRFASEIDPAGLADLDAGVDLDNGYFGVPGLPGWGATGDLLGIRTSATRVSPRMTADWRGSTGAFLDTAISSLASLDIGAAVSVAGVQATPWSTDGRFALFQDADGAGVWVDGELWGIDTTLAGDAGTWRAEVRREGGIVRLRSWRPLAVDSSADVVVTDALVDGALVDYTLETLDPPDALGHRTSGDLVVDDRFGEIDGLVAPVTVRAAVRVDADGGTILSPF